MVEISVYTFEDADGNDVGTYSTQSFVEADNYAMEYHLRVIDKLPGNGYRYVSVTEAIRRKEAGCESQT